MSRTLAGLAAVAALALGIAVGWTVQQWRPSPDLAPGDVELLERPVVGVSQ
ncbi:hypothetical protein [Demequina sp.]|uniref:hypothetical protein n=1 Tax=Demequina sp. TaxID=2050685 RepID=UPI003A88127E